MFHSTENIILGERQQLESPSTQYQVINETQSERNQKVILIDKNELKVKPSSKRKSNGRQKEEKPEKCFECPSCGNRNWMNIDEG